MCVVLSLSACGLVPPDLLVTFTLLKGPPFAAWSTMPFFLLALEKAGRLTFLAFGLSPFLGFLGGSSGGILSGMHQSFFISSIFHI